MENIQIVWAQADGVEHTPKIEAMSGTFLELLRVELEAFDIATAAFEHEVLDIELPPYLYAQKELPEDLRDTTVQVRMEYDGKQFDLTATVQEGHPPGPAPKIVRDSIRRDRYSLLQQPVISAEDARNMVALLLRYSSAPDVRIKTR